MRAGWPKTLVIFAVAAVAVLFLIHTRRGSFSATHGPVSDLRASRDAEIFATGIIFHADYCRAVAARREEHYGMVELMASQAPPAWAKAAAAARSPVLLC